jgi:cytochrome c oxidase cbb3-type subunit 4
MDLERLQSILSTLWVVWFFILFGGIIWYVMRPSKRAYYQRLGEIPFRDTADKPASRRSP